MRTGLSQHTSLRQELRVNPRLYQAMDMLYMPMMDLQQHLKQELLANPFLELLEPEEETPEQKDAEQEKEQKEKEEEMDWEEILLNGFEVGGTREQYEQLEYTEPVTVETKDLIDHLREQLQMLTLTPRQLLLAEEFLGNINEEGYLAASLEEILELGEPAGRPRTWTGRRTEEGEEDRLRPRSRRRPRRPPRRRQPRPRKARRPRRRSRTSRHRPTTRWPRSRRCWRIIQKLDPPGIGARDLRECLLIQLREQEDTESLTYRLVDEAFPDLIAHRWNDLAKRFGVEPAAVQAAADELARLDPKPGLKYADQSDGYIIPDLIVDKIGEPLPGLPERHRDAPAPAEPLLSGDRARQEEDDPGEPRVHRLQDEQRQLDDPGDRAAPADHAQGDELHRGPAARLLREGRSSTSSRSRCARWPRSSTCTSPPSAG